MRSELRSVATEQVVGAVQVVAEVPRFDGAAAAVFAGVRRRLGDLAAAQMLIADGWSNGYLYLAPGAAAP